jgi:transcriptional regulator with XRE-family HTH domain
MIKEKILGNIKTIREARNITGEYVATQMGISQSTYNRKENGEIEFSLNDLLKVSEVLEVSMTRIVDQDLAQIITQTNNINDTSTGNNIYRVDTQNFMAEGYKVAIETQDKEIIYLRTQIDRFMEKVVK